MASQQKTNHWQAIFAQQAESNLSISRFCKQHKINSASYYAWRKRLASDDSSCSSTPKQQIVPLFLGETPIQQRSPFKLTTPGGYQLEFDDHLTAQTLRSILSALE